MNAIIEIHHSNTTRVMCDNAGDIIVGGLGEMQTAATELTRRYAAKRIAFTAVEMAEGEIIDG